MPIVNMSPKHLRRYVSEFARKHNVRDSGTLAQMQDTVARLVGGRLLYRDLVADNGLSSGSAGSCCGTLPARAHRRRANRVNLRVEKGDVSGHWAVLAFTQAAVAATPC